MKKVYIAPDMSMENCEMEAIVCTSVIEPGKPNTPPGARRFDGWDDEEDDYWDE